MALLPRALRRRLSCCLALCLLLPFSRGTSEPHPLYPPPLDRASQPAWLAGLHAQREEIRRAINYTGAVYLDPAVNWTRLSYIQPQIHLYDRFLYDPIEHKYTVDRYLDDLKQRYGGIDSVLLWPTYTNIGIDARNQFDYYRSLPGGLAGLRDLTAQFKERGVRVLWGYNPWDQGTRDEGVPHWVTLTQLLKETGGDGFNGDTMSTMYKQFWDEGVALDYRIVGEMEGGGYPVTNGRPEDASWEGAEWSLMGWGYFRHDKNGDNITYRYNVAPGIDKLKFLDGRRMTHVCDRWAKNRTDPMQYAFLNGVGFESWENVWGIFMHFTPRDGEALRRVSTLLRWLGREHFIQGYEEWEPYSLDLVRDDHLPFEAGGPIASRFVHVSGDCVWLVVNRAALDDVFELNIANCGGGTRQLFDLYHGTAVASQQGKVQVPIEANGFGVVLATSRSLPLKPLLQEMRSMTRRPLRAFSAAWAPLPQRMVGSWAPTTHSTAPAGMVTIPKTAYRFRAAGTDIEGGCNLSQDTFGVCCVQTLVCPRDQGCKIPCAFAATEDRGVDAQFPWEDHPRRFHDRVLELGPFFVDKSLVSKFDFARFMSATGYSPRDAYNFLVGWRKNSSGLMPAAGEEQEPVVWVSLAEARAFCTWAGKRLPHTYEWQLAAQGTDGRLFPWGNTLDESGQRHPLHSQNRSVPKLPPRGSYSPAGDSVFGVADLVGTVWQYTDEFNDEHTRTVLLKGSSLYAPMLSADFPALRQVGNWYFPQSPQVDRHGRMMLMDDTYERAATLGFRCVADHPETPAAPFHFRDLGAAVAGGESAALLFA